MLVVPPCKHCSCPAPSSENSPETALSTKHQGWTSLTVFFIDHFVGKGRGENSPVSPGVSPRDPLPASFSGTSTRRTSPSSPSLPSPPLSSFLEPEIGCFLEPGPSPAKPWKKPPQAREPAAYYYWLLMLSLPWFLSVHPSWFQCVPTSYLNCVPEKSLYRYHFFHLDTEMGKTDTNKHVPAAVG